MRRRNRCSRQSCSSGTPFRVPLRLSGVQTVEAFRFLPGTVIRTVPCELIDHAIEIGIASAKASRDPVPAARRDPLAVGEHIKLAVLTRRANGFDVQALLDEGHETRDLGPVVLSRRTVNYLDLHSPLQSKLCLVSLPTCSQHSNQPEPAWGVLAASRKRGQVLFACSRSKPRIRAPRAAARLRIRR